MIDSLDQNEWSPPAAPLTLGEIQRGIAPVSYVRNERASEPFDGEFDHWSALPALSYFALNAVTLRESLRRIPPPTSFRPPPRLTLSDQRRKAWLNELKSPNVPLRSLSRAIPHGFTSTKLLYLLVQDEIPISRATWFVKCVGANEVRALKRKVGAMDQAEHQRIEQSWLSEWTEAVTTVISQVIDSFDEIVIDSAEPELEPEPEPATESGAVAGAEAGAETGETGTETGTETGVDAADENTTLINETNDDDSMNDLFGEPSSEETNGGKPDSAATIPSDSKATAIATATTTAAPTAPTNPGHSQLESWQKRMEYVSLISVSLYNASLLDRRAYLDWLIAKLKTCKPSSLPCFVHLVQLVWKPMTSTPMAPVLLKAIAYRYKQVKPVEPSATNETATATTAHIISTYLEPLIFKMMSTNEDTFVSPRTWPIVEPHVRNHPAYPRVAERNQAFMPRDPHDPSDWSQPLAIGALLDNFARPYQLDELLRDFAELDVDTEVLIRTILLRTLRQGTSGSIILCIVLLKRLAPDCKYDTISECCVEFLLDPHLIHGSECLGSLVSELVKARLCHLEKYINKLIARGVLEKPSTETQGPDLTPRELHIRILQNLPRETLPPNLRTQTQTMLWRAGSVVKPANLDLLVRGGMDVLNGKQSFVDLEAEVRTLYVNDAHLLAENWLHLFEEQQQSPESVPQDPSAYAHFAELMDIAGMGSVKPLFKMLNAAISSPFARPAIIRSSLRQVHIRLMAFVCSGLIDPFVRRLLLKLEDCVGMSANRHHKVFEWISWDDISALRAVIQSPDVMCELNSMVPLRQPLSPMALAAGKTPMERDQCVRDALYQPGGPDIGILIAMRGDEGLSHDIVEWAQSPNADRTALLQLVTYHAVQLDELINGKPDNFELLRFLLLAPSSELGFCLEEVEAIRLIRYEFLSRLPLDEMLEISASVPSIEFSSRIAHVYPELFLNNVVRPAMENEAALARLKRATATDIRPFEMLFLRCNPFNLRFYQGLVQLVFNGMDAEDIADEVLCSAHRHPAASPALQGLLQNLDDDVKNLIFTKTVNEFLSHGLDADELPQLDVHFMLVGALASSVASNAQWSLDRVPQFLDHLVELAKNPECERKIVRKALILVLRISVVAGLHELEIPAAAVPYLETLLHVQAFADNYKMRTIIEDALRLLLRITYKCNDHRHAVLVDDRDQMLNAGPSATDGLRVYSKSRDQYERLPVWPFDLIEDANPTIGKNDGAIDLALFETYED